MSSSTTGATGQLPPPQRVAAPQETSGRIAPQASPARSVQLSSDLDSYLSGKPKLELETPRLSLRPPRPSSPSRWAGLSGIGETRTTQEPPEPQRFRFDSSFLRNSPPPSGLDLSSSVNLDYGEALGAIEEPEKPWTKRFTALWGNDIFANGGDDGITQGLGLRFDASRDGWTFGAEAQHWMITESREFNREAKGRIDLGQFLFTAERDFYVGDTRFRFGPALGLQATGNLGGREVQNGFHDIFDAGRTVGNGLQDTYIAGTRVVPVVGATLEMEHQLGTWLGGRWSVDGQVRGLAAIGDAGVSSVTGRAMMQYELDSSLVGIRPFVRAGVASGWHHTDELGALDGSYQSGRVYLSPAVEAGLRFGRSTSLTWGMMTDFHGSGEAVGYLGLSFTFGGNDRSRTPYRY